MKVFDKFYIGGQWVAPAGGEWLEVINPATLEVAGKTPQGTVEDTDRAVAAARSAFAAWAAMPMEERVDYVEKLAAAIQDNTEEMARLVTAELGSPINVSRQIQLGLGFGVMSSYVDIGREFARRPLEKIGNSEIYHEPVGVCGFITPWNFPLHQIVAKLAPALVAGCTVVVKPSSETPLTAFAFAELVDRVGLPAGVFNIVAGPGRTVGERLCTHPEVDMVSITGSVRAGARVAELAAPSIKRVAQELGGKSPCIILEGAPLEDAVPAAVEGLGITLNSGQVCAALSRLIVPRARQEEVIKLAHAAAERVVVGDPSAEETAMGPVVSQAQQQVVLDYIRRGIDEGARLVAGGLEPPAGCDKGAYVQPTVFADVAPDMAIAREEIFGPVLVIIPVDSEEEAIAVANNSEFGLSGGVWAADTDSGRRVARQMRTAQVAVNGGQFNVQAPFGGYKHSGNGRELGPYGLHEYLEIKAIQI